MESHEIDIKPESLHYRVYQHWKMNSRQGWRYMGKENLCHYFWTVIFWWFFHYPVYKKVVPWMVGTPLALTIATAYSYSRWPGVVRDLFFIVISALLATAIVGTLLYTVLRLIERSWLVRKILKWVTSPIWGGPYLLVVGFEIFENKVLAPRRMTFWHWFFLSHKWYIITPWSVLIAAIATLCFVLSGVEGMKTFFQILGIILGAVAVSVILALIIVGMIYGIKWLKSKLRRKKREGISYLYPEDAPRKQSFIDIGRYYWNAKKGTRICPYINLPGESDDRQLRDFYRHN